MVVIGKITQRRNYISYIFLYTIMGIYRIFIRVSFFIISSIAILRPPDIHFLISGISNSYAFDRFQKGSRIDIKPLKDWLKINIFLFRFSIVAVFSLHHQIAIVPPQDIHIPLQTIGCPKPDDISSKTESGIVLFTAKDCLMIRE